MAHHFLTAVRLGKRPIGVSATLPSHGDEHGHQTQRHYSPSLLFPTASALPQEWGWWCRSEPREFRQSLKREPVLAWRRGKAGESRY